jgi:hypothetical protein
MSGATVIQLDELEKVRERKPGRPWPAKVE